MRALLLDVVCDACDATYADVFVEGDLFPACSTCGGPTRRAWAAAPSVHGDDIPGGYWVHHGLCHRDGSPRRYDTRSAMAKEGKRRGLVNLVKHAPEPGTDKSRLTQRFV